MSCELAAHSFVSARVLLMGPDFNLVFVKLVFSPRLPSAIKWLSLHSGVVLMQVASDGQDNGYLLM